MKKLKYLLALPFVFNLGLWLTITLTGLYTWLFTGTATWLVFSWANDVSEPLVALFIMTLLSLSLAIPLIDS